MRGAGGRAYVDCASVEIGPTVGIPGAFRRTARFNDGIPSRRPLVPIEVAMSPIPPARRVAGLPLGEWAAILFILTVLTALLLPSVSTGVSSRHQRTCRSNLTQIALALHNYHDTFGSLPPAVVYGPDGKPWHSWRVLVLPYVGAGNWNSHYRLDEPWNGPHNRQLAEKTSDLPLFRCPSEKATVPQTTSYLAVVGEGTMWPPHGAVAFGDVTDGTSNTILVVEVAGSDVHWMEPRDLELDTLDFASAGPAVRGPHGGTKRWFGPDDPPLANVLFADGHVEILDPAATPAAVRSMLLRADGGPARE